MIRNKLLKSPLVVFGATAVGKTHALLCAAPHGKTEIISADSRQVYNTLEIGTTVPSKYEQQKIPHHLIQTIDAGFTVARFVQECDNLVIEITKRGKLPVISGGTAFYLRGYLYGAPGTPPSDNTQRAMLQMRLRQEGLAILRSELGKIDPVSEKKILPNDTYRVLRALEVYYTSGKPLSSYKIPQTFRHAVKPRIIGLWRDRKELYARIDKRVDALFEAGLVQEAEALAANWQAYQESNHTSNTHVAFQTIGYKEFFEVAGAPPWQKTEIEIIKKRIARNTRRYAKRQELFFRSFPNVEWIHADDISTLAGIFGKLTKNL